MKGKDMAPVRSLLALFCILTLAAVACSISIDLGTSPSGAPIQRLSSQDQLATMVAGTLQALTEAARAATAANTPTPTSTATPTNTSVPPTLSVSAATHCYAGPSSNYGFVITIYPGTTVTVAGKDVADDYWIINVPGYPGTLCWLSGKYVQVIGDTTNLSAPATPLASKYTLSEPRNLRVSCNSEDFSDPDDPWWHDESEWTVVFRWTNTEPDQAGVRVFRNGRQLATLGARASSYTDTVFHHDRHREVTYGVQAFAAGAVSSIVTVDVRHCD